MLGLRFATAVCACCVLPTAPSAAAVNPTLTNLWTVEIGRTSDSTPAISPDGTIYFGDRIGKLWALKPDGSRKWVFEAGREIVSSPAIGDDGVIYFGSRDHRLYALQPEGKPKWTFMTGGWVDSSPAIAADGTLYFGSWDTNFYAVGRDGVIKWSFPTGGPIVSSPAIGADGTIYFGAHDRKFYALLPNGQKKWEFATGGPIISSPALNGNECLYFSSVDGNLYALNMDGTLRWQLKTGGATQSSPTIGPKGTIFIGASQEFWVISPEGRRIDRHLIGATIETTPTVLADDTFVYAREFGPLVDWDWRNRWEPRWVLQIVFNGHASATIGPDGTVYNAAYWHNFCAFQATVPLAESPWPKFRGNPRNTGRQEPAAPRTQGSRP